MSRVLVIFAHPAFERSRVNRALIAAARSVKGVTVHDLYETYPDFLIEVREEQRLLESHDTIVLQHPFFWYSSPALVKEWLDLVLSYRWAYGEGGTALRGKILAHAISAGGPEAAYCREGANHFSVRELLAPFEQTARLCGMGYAEAFAVHGAHHLDAAALAAESLRYQAWLGSLRDGDGAAPLWLFPP
ncbi:NAD(P)H-dependent oxidoreductase [Luteolibacter flavescens]|uniref:NAD(P)H-dependent oxidoreductase n=1 Tax=Luteolibacter flavescens TaxID=1859460 RepID=A0ABT3FN04_9BACT|nr:NAD(P)H-dependent oxidoreductase [Luteolibacter flavescens]MCW1884365.1 NAD(P)H-dependent oxidoreductase [Luteolibacter flavescens]